MWFQILSLLRCVAVGKKRLPTRRLCVLSSLCKLTYSWKFILDTFTLYITRNHPDIFETTHISITFSRQTSKRFLLLNLNLADKSIFIIVFFCYLQIAQDLVRFLRCIGADELDSPPRSPTFVKPHHPPPLSPTTSVDGDDITYAVNPHARSTSVSTRASLTRGSSMDKGFITRTPSTEKGSLSRSGSVDKTRKTVAASSPTSTTQPK